MIGCFDIECAARDGGVTQISRQSISAPWHLGKPYWNGRTLLIQAVNATAGFFAGDQLHLRASIGTGSSVLLTSPSASRIHTMHGGEATLEQEIHVGASSWLEWMPELFIPQRQAKYRQSTAMHVERGGGLYFVEAMAPGRVAHGEALAFDQLTWRTRIRHGDQWVWAENYTLRPDDDSLVDLKRTSDAGYFASAILITPQAMAWREKQSAVHEMAGQDLSIGATQIDGQVYLFRMIAANSVALKDALTQLRSLLSVELEALRETARKL